MLRTDKLSGLKISGFVSTPDYTRASKKDYYMYVNSRLVKCPAFQKAVDERWQELLDLEAMTNNIKKLAISEKYTVQSKIREIIKALMHKPKFVFNK